jgi:hypothetical protein
MRSQLDIKAGTPTPMFADRAQVTGQSEAAMSDRIVQAVVSYNVESDAQWIALSKDVPGVSYFATDLDARSFEKDEARGTWLGRAELLLKAPAELRPGQAMQEVSFTLPVKVVLSEQDGEFFVTSFDFYRADDIQSSPSQTHLEYGPPKTIGWGPFAGLV